MAEKYLKSIDKILNRGLVYLKLDGEFYKIEKIEIKCYQASFHCKQISTGKAFEIKFQVKPEMFTDLVSFGLKDQKYSIFIILKEANDSIWFETSIYELIKQIDDREIREEIKRELYGYEDMEKF